MRKEKQLLLDELKGKIERSNNFVITRYHALNANAANEFRGLLEKGGADYEVVKKRVLRRAASDMGITLDDLKLEGHIGVVFPGGDPLGTTKAVYEYHKEADTVAIVGGHIDGRVCDGPQVEKLAKLPSKDEMRAQLLGLFEAPMAQTVSVMNSMLCSVIYCLDNKVKQGGGEAA